MAPMAPQPAMLQTSWLRVEGPQDAETCAWCARWVGRLVPVELKASYAAQHGAKHPCRCRLVPQELRPDPEDPDCAWA